ncbi:hypothetical protein [Massilia rubra]|nr:hypothetical protein [Massilia rubra]
MFISSHPHAATSDDSAPERRVNVAACRRRRHASTSFLPPPDIMRQYGGVIADAPERILKILEADSAHLRERQLNIINAKMKDIQRVHWMTYSFIAGGYGMTLIFAMMNKDVLAGIVLTTTIIGTVTSFMKQRHDRATDVSEKATSSE